MKPHIRSLRALAFLCFTGLSAASQAAYLFTGFDASHWGASNAALGLSPDARIEDFEDVTLIAGLQIQVTDSSAGSYGPTGTLPHAFAPVTEDGFGNAFDAGVWDGTHVLLNTGTNQSHAYASFSAWGDITLSFDQGARQVGFSLQQMSYNANLYINGVLAGSVSPALTPSGARLGYLRIDVTGDSAPITHLRIDGADPDAWTLDHLAITPAVPEPDVLVLLLIGIGLTGCMAHRQHARRTRPLD